MGTNLGEAEVGPWSSRQNVRSQGSHASARPFGEGLRLSGTRLRPRRERRPACVHSECGLQPVPIGALGSSRDGSCSRLRDGSP